MRRPYIPLLALLISAVVAALVPAEAALTVSQRVIQGTTASYSIVTITGTMNGTTPVEAAFSVKSPFVGGSLALLVTGEISDAAITAKFRNARFQSGEADLIDQATPAVGGSGRAALTCDIFEQVTDDPPHMAAPAGQYIFSLVSDDGSSAGVVSATLLFVFVP